MTCTWRVACVSQVETRTPRPARHNPPMPTWIPDPDPRWFTTFKAAAVAAVGLLITVLAVCAGLALDAKARSGSRNVTIDRTM